MQKETKPTSMKLTKNQLSTLNDLHQDKSWPVDTVKANKKTLNTLFLNGFIKSVRFANGCFYEVTYKGRCVINELNKK